LRDSHAFFVAAFTFFGTAHWSGFRAVTAAVRVVSLDDAIAILDEAVAIIVGAIVLCHILHLLSKQYELTPRGLWWRLIADYSCFSILLVIDARAASKPSHGSFLNRASRLGTLRMVNSARTSSLSSSQRSGVETDAPERARVE
jgi:hypothetical protein